MTIAALGWLVVSGRLTSGWLRASIMLIARMIAFLAASTWDIAACVHPPGTILERIARLPGVRRKLRPDIPAVHRTEDLLRRKGRTR